MITHTNAIVQISKTRFQQGVIFDNIKFVAGHCDDFTGEFRPALLDVFECKVASISITKNAMDEDVAIVEQG